MTTFTVSAIKADVGSPGGHMRPGDDMIEIARTSVEDATKNGLLVDGWVSHTGDDTCLLMVHRKGVGAPDVHNFAHKVFMDMTQKAKDRGYYAAGQDLLVDAPSGNLKGAGPGVAEIECTFGTPERKVESFMLVTADKCGPGAYGFPLAMVFANPMHNTGLLLKKEMFAGFDVTVLDMNHTDGDRTITIHLPEEHLLLYALLRNPDRFAILEIHSRMYPEHQIVSVAATRLHNISGVYSGKDDPAMLIRTQGVFPAPEELVHPWAMIDQIVTGDCRGSHNMPIMPVALNSAINGPYCHPIAAAAAFSLSHEGRLSQPIDCFGGPGWDYVRLRNQEFAIKFRQQGTFGVALAAQEELAYTGLKALDSQLAERFETKRA
ncbi:MAG: fructose 1,6-bisphosphatase [Candidatus Levybacteria bacterium]|nr:fructose 1,6-bisphosphatase [Candidatus Levybacteria bacterium]